MQETGVVRQAVFKAGQIAGRANLPGQKRRQMARHRWILGIGQTDLGQRRPRPAGWMGGNLDPGKEAFNQGVSNFGAGQFGAQGAADQFGAATRHDDRRCGQCGVAEQGFLGVAATVGQRLHLPGIKVCSLFSQFGANRMSQRQIHVISAEQDVIADRYPHQFQ